MRQQEGKAEAGSGELPQTPAQFAYVIRLPRHTDLTPHRSLFARHLHLRARFQFCFNPMGASDDFPLVDYRHASTDHSDDGLAGGLQEARDDVYYLENVTFMVCPNNL